MWWDGWSMAGTSHICSRWISRRSPLCGGTAGPGLMLVRLAYARSAGGPIMWLDGWSRPGRASASQVCSRRISRRSPLCGGTAVPGLAQGRCQSGWLTRGQQAVPFCGGMTGPGRVAISEYGKAICGRMRSVGRVLISANLI